MPYVTDPGDWSQWVEELAIEQAEAEFEQYICRCPRCNALGLSLARTATTGYHCSCIHIFRVINPATAETLEGA